MPSKGSRSGDLQPMGPGYWRAYFDAIATGELLLKPHTARRRAGDVARSCPFPEIAAAGLAKVKAALEATGTVTKTSQ